MYLLHVLFYILRRCGMSNPTLSPKLSLNWRIHTKKQDLFKYSFNIIIK